LEIRDKEDMTDDLEEYRQKHFLNTKPGSNEKVP
jgi:hypothetical protein